MKATVNIDGMEVPKIPGINIFRTNRSVVVADVYKRPCRYFCSKDYDNSLLKAYVAAAKYVKETLYGRYFTHKNRLSFHADIVKSDYAVFYEGVDISVSHNIHVHFPLRRVRTQKRAIRVAFNGIKVYCGTSQTADLSKELFEKCVKVREEILERTVNKEMMLSLEQVCELV